MRVLLVTLLAFATTVVAQQPASPITIDNDTSCDIANLPAATLLLPYFEVDIIGDVFGDTQNTIFTITNTSHDPQIARVTLWTDLAFPVTSFNIFLTGYDVQSISLHDVLVAGRTGSKAPPPGPLSAGDNPLVDEKSCAHMPLAFDAATIARLQQVFTTGREPGCKSNLVGMFHTNAVGYATVDVVGSCSSSMPTDASYFTEDIRFDNVLIGDYVQVESRQDFAQGNPMVHIRAIPEGGHPAVRRVDPAYAVTSPRTFYDRYGTAAHPRFDARQPLPSVFAARWIEGGATGFETFFKVWREGVEAGACSSYTANAKLTFTEVVRFDEEENPHTFIENCQGIPCYSFEDPVLAPAALAEVSNDDVFPPNPDGAVSGWMYLNLGYADLRSATEQAWVVSSLRAEDRFSVDTPAQALGNGCSPLVAVSEASGGEPPMGPSPNAGVNDNSCDIAALPAATLLLPYFEVDIEALAGTRETTLFTVTNTSHLPQVARVTLWTDLAYPILAFNIYLTGYDAQTINLFYVLAHGDFAAHGETGSAVSPVGDLSGTSATREFDNPLVDEESCAEATPPKLSNSMRNRIIAAFTRGTLPSGGSEHGCLAVGRLHSNAVGYATIDVVGNCSRSLPTDPAYFSDEIRFDNVLIGEYVQVNGEEDYAQGNAMVHLRAIPEGGRPRERTGAAFDAGFPATFYGAYQSIARPAGDARQPLPSAFAARWISGGPTAFNTFFKIWRGPNTAAVCRALPARDMQYVEVVRFDEDENPQTYGNGCGPLPVCLPLVPTLPATSLANASDLELFPPAISAEVAGWMYVNLDDGSDPHRAAQGWIASSMRAEGRFSVDMDAAALGNGCSAPMPVTNAHAGEATIGPLPNRRDP